MTVEDLINELAECDLKSQVIVQRNDGFSPLSEVYDNAVYVADTTWCGDVYDLDWSADDACMEEDEWEKITNLPQCVVLASIV